jgi:hypothetical protein
MKKTQRELMIENIKRVRAILSEGPNKRLQPSNNNGPRIMQAIETNVDLVDVRKMKKRGEFNADEVKSRIEAAGPVIKNSIKAALKFNYKLHPEIPDNPSSYHRDYYRFSTKSDIQKALDKTMVGLKELDKLVDAAMKKPSAASLQRVGDFWSEMNRDAGSSGYLVSQIKNSGKGLSSFIA